MDDKEQLLRTELAELDSKLQDPAIFSDKASPKIAKRKSELEAVIALFNEKARLLEQKKGAEVLRNSSDSEMQAMATHELEELEPKISANLAGLIAALTAKDPNDGRSVIIEIPVSAGGHESSLFA